MPLHIAVRGAGSKMRACLRPIVEAEHGSNHPVQLVGQMDRSGPAAIGAAGMLELLQVHAKSGIELGHRPGEHDRPPARVLLHRGKTVLVPELLDCLDIGRGRPELLGVLPMGQVTLGLVAGGRFPLSDALPYIIAQVVGACSACGVFSLIGHHGASYAANGWGDTLSMLKATQGQVFIIETVLTAFFLLVIMGVTRKNGPSIMAPVAIGLTLTAIHIMAIPISNASVNPARSLASALYAGGEALSQVWLFWVAPILGGVIGGKLGNWLLGD
jgi:aquaporin Z